MQFRAKRFHRIRSQHKAGFLLGALRDGADQRGGDRTGQRPAENGGRLVAAVHLTRVISLSVSEESRIR